MRRSIALAGLGLLAAAPAPAGAGRASLPQVKSGPLPGPAMLYAPAPPAPQLENVVPFRAAPLLTSGVSAYARGEFLYQDYLFDDHGADIEPLRGENNSSADDIAAASAGDLAYPADKRYAGNAADLVEFRVRPTRRELVYRITLNTALAADAAVVGIGIDRDRKGGEQVAWPRGAGITSPGIDAFITAWGTGGEVQDLPGGEARTLPADAVTMDLARNQMTIRVPRSVLDPGRATWRHVAGTGLWDGRAWTRPDAGAPAPFNLAFRHDEPQQKAPNPQDTTFPGTGNWFEAGQARTLAGGTTGAYAADIDFGRLAGGDSATAKAPPGREQARIFASALELPEGLREDGGFPRYGGQLQPYLLTVPPGYEPGRPAPLTFSLHSLGGTYTQYKVFSPNWLRQLGDQRGSFVASPLGRGTNGWYTDEAEADVFEVWADVARHFDLDPERVAITGYSMGGYGSYKLAGHYPDLFGAAFTVVGPPANGLKAPPLLDQTTGAEGDTRLTLENVRWIPFMNWVELTDELVPYPSVLEQFRTFDALGLRHRSITFTPGEHFTPAILDRWGAGRDFLGEARVLRDPPRVTFTYMPASDRPKLDLIHDHAYWVANVRLRDPSAGSEAEPARGRLDARSHAFGLGDPPSAAVPGAVFGLGIDGGPGAVAAGSENYPLPGFELGREWGAAPAVPARNALTLDLDDIGSLTIDGARARLSARAPLTLSITTDGPVRVDVALPMGRKARVTRAEGGRAAVSRVGVYVIVERAGKAEIEVAP